MYVNNKTKSIEVNKNVLSTLLAISAKMNKVIDFSLALKYPLAPVPLRLSNPDGSRRTTTKSKLNEIIMRNTKTLDFKTEMPLKSDVSAYIVDLMALIR